MENTAESTSRLELSPTTRPERVGSDQAARDLGDELVLHEPEGGRIHVLNASARRIFLMCDGSRDLGAIAAGLAEHFGIDEETALRDTSSAVRDLVRLGFLRLA